MLTVNQITPYQTELILNYWYNASDIYLQGMGATRSKLPLRGDMSKFLLEQINLPYEQKQSYCIIWQSNHVPVGHCNVNKIEFGNQASMHLHLWNPDQRKKGMGVEFVKKSLPYFFNNLKLQKVYSEPYALNPAPSKTLGKVGFFLS